MGHVNVLRVAPREGAGTPQAFPQGTRGLAFTKAAQAACRQRRKLLDMTRERLAQCVGCSVSALRKIEDDERRSSRPLAERLAACLVIAPADRPTFLSVARADLRAERLPPPADSW
ncbi:MAG TPA: helix-turn-helix transcriptional regulator [Roseiflexaceae bacterium]|nr:helix-turn-helix transcriptional regulator [Roseiflexaceae bacterium]